MVDITEENFHEHFFDVRKHRPQKGQVLARFSAIAEFVDGVGKLSIIGLLKQNKAYQAAQVMKKIHGAKEPDCYRICREIAEDLLKLSDKEVENKPYEYVMESFYYTKKENIPKNKHWSTISLMEYNKDSNSYKSVIEV